MGSMVNNQEQHVAQGKLMHSAAVSIGRISVMEVAPMVEGEDRTDCRVVGGILAGRRCRRVEVLKVIAGLRLARQLLNTH
jgi:hypothetical protein